MRYLDGELMQKLRSMPLDKREVILEGLVKMVADRPRDFSDKPESERNPDKDEN